MAGLKGHGNSAVRLVEGLRRQRSGWPKALKVLKDPKDWDAFKSGLNIKRGICNENK